MSTKTTVKETGKEKEEAIAFDFSVPLDEQVMTRDFSLSLLPFWLLML